MSVGLVLLTERSGVLSITQFAYRKDMGTCDALLCVSHTLQSALESGQEARIVQIDFSAAFEGSTIRAFSISSVLSILTVSIKPITACYGGWLSE